MQLSYVIISHNRREHLLACLESFGAGDPGASEVVVVLDGCDDGSASAVAARFPSARRIELPERSGICCARNAGIEAATGDVLVFLDDDARLRDATAPTRVAAKIEATPRLAIVGFRILVADTGREERQAIPRVDKRSVNDDEEIAYFAGGGFAARRAALVDVGGFWRALRYGGEELDLSYRLLDRDWTLRYGRLVEVDHYADPAGRKSGYFVASYAQNRPWIATRHLPWRYVLSTTLAWWAYTGWLALRRRHLGAFVRGVVGCLRGLPRALRLRKRLRPETLAKLRQLSGRRWY